MLSGDSPITRLPTKPTVSVDYDFPTIVPEHTIVPGESHCDIVETGNESWRFKKPRLIFQKQLFDQPRSPGCATLTSFAAASAAVETVTRASGSSC